MSRIKIHSYDENQISFFNIDQHAFKATLDDATDFPTLLAYLMEPIPVSTGNHALYLARAIIAWLCHAQTVFSERIIGRDHREPIRLAQSMENRELFHSEVFKLFCDEASIECYIVYGRCKAVAYKAGDTDNAYLKEKHSWNAIRVDDKWHLLNPAWVLHAVIDYRRGGERELVGQTKNTFPELPHFEGTQAHVFNDFWFCTNPEIFATRCLPFSSDWQLLSEQNAVSSVHQFLSLPDLKQGFYRAKLELLTDKSCRLRTKNGRCLVAFSTDRETAKRLQFSYQLTLVHGKFPGSHMDEISRCIYHSRPCGNIFNFEVRFLFTGLFRLTIMVGNIHGQSKRTCGEFLIKCDQVDEDCKQLPIDVGEEGWGPGTVSDDAGIGSSSEKTGKVVLETSTKDPSKKVKAIILKPREDALRETVYESVIYGSDEVNDEDTIVGSPGVVTVDRKRCRLVLDVETSGGRESALVVTARNKKSHKESATPILNYLLLSREEAHDKEEREGLKKKEMEIRKDLKAKSKREIKESLKRTLRLYTDEVDGCDAQECVGDFKKKSKLYRRKQEKINFISFQGRKLIKNEIKVEGLCRSYPAHYLLLVYNYYGERKRDVHQQHGIFHHLP